MQGNTAEQEVQSIKSTLSRVRSDLGELASEVVELGKTEAKDARAKLEQRVKQRVESLRKELEEESQETKQALEQIAGRVKEHPVASILTALGVGYVLGKFFERK